MGVALVAPRVLKRAFAPPQAVENQTPEDFGLAAKDVWLTTRNNLRLHAWFIESSAMSPSPASAVVVLHGWGANSSLMLPLANLFHLAGYHALFVDARNHGQSDHDDFSSMPRFAEDLDVAVEWLESHPHVSSIGVLGHSVGAAASILSASRSDKIDAVVAVSSFAHPGDMMREQMAQIPGPILEVILSAVQHIIGLTFDEFAPRSRIGLVGVPVLLVHGDEDDVVPLANVYELSEAAPASEVLVVPGGGHRELEPYLPYSEQIVEFLDRSMVGTVSVAP